MLKITIFDLKGENVKELYNKAILQFNEMRNSPEEILKEAIELN